MCFRIRFSRQFIGWFSLAIVIAFVGVGCSKDSTPRQKDPTTDLQETQKRDDTETADPDAETTSDRDAELSDSDSTSDIEYAETLSEVVAPETETGLTQRLQTNVKTLATDYAKRNIQNPETYQAAASHLETKMETMGYEPRRQSISTDGQTFPNVIVEKEGASQSDQIVVVGAHYDAVTGSPGADDNASGVAGVLQIARHFSDREIDKTLRFVLFAEEERGLKGSLKHASTASERGENIVMMFSMEMLGYYSDEPGSQDYPEGIDLLYPNRQFPEKGNFIGFVTRKSDENAIKEMTAIFNQAASINSEYLAGPPTLSAVSRSDHSSFWEHGFPGVMVTDTANYRNPHYHRSSDKPDTLDYEAFSQTVTGLIAVIAHWVNRT